MYKIIAICLSAALLSSEVGAEANTSDVRDPTTPLGHVAVNTSGNAVQQFTLNSILISPQRKLAIINGNTLREGQLIPGSANVRVQRISAQGVVLLQAEKPRTLRLSPSIIKRH